MTASIIKWIAVVSMLLDHIGAVFQESLHPDLYETLRALGRIAFPLYAFLLVEGFFHTRSRGKYLLRLVILMVLSELPFDRAFYSHAGSPMYWGHQNIFLTLSLGLGAMMLLEWLRTKCPLGRQGELSAPAGISLPGLLLQGVVVLGSAMLVECLHGDYQFMGIYLILLFYYLRGSRWGQPVALLAWLIYYDLAAGYVMELYGAVAILLIWFYNGQKGQGNMPKWFFYGFYPAHLLLLILVRSLLIGG